MKTIAIIMLGILLLSCVSAIDITAGETYSFILNEEYIYYEVTGNQTEIDLNITKDGNNVTIKFGKYIEDSFTITFYNSQGEIDLPQQKGGGGSSYTKKKLVIVNETENKTEEVEDDLFPIGNETEEIIVDPIEEPESDNGWKTFILVCLGLSLVGFLYWRFKD